MGATVSPMGDFGMEGLRTTMLALLAAVAFVLLIACVNVANLLLARGAARQKEFAIRRALGAPGSRIARQLLTESVLLALAGGAAGLLLAAWSTRLLFYVFKLDALHLPMRPIDSIPMDGRVFAFALLVSCLTGVLFGLAPALSALRTGVNEPLKEGGRGASTGGRNRLRHVLVASEVALAMVVLSGAGLMIKSMTRLLGVDPGLNPKNVLAMGMSVPQEEIYVGPPGLPRFLSGSGRARRRHSGRCLRRRGRAFAVSRKRGPELPDRRTAAGGPGTNARRELQRRLPELFPDHGHSGPEGAGVHAAGYRQCAGGHRHQRDHGAYLLA